MKLETCPPIEANPAHHNVVALCAHLDQKAIESFFYRVVHNRTTALFMREVLYWFMPAKANPTHPRAVVYRDDRYWFTKRRDEWREECEISRYQLEKAYEQCADFLSIDHFRWGAGDRQTHYALDFEKLRALMEQDEKLRRQMDRLATGPAPASRVNPPRTGGDKPLRSDGGRVAPPSSVQSQAPSEIHSNHPKPPTAVCSAAPSVVVYPDGSPTATLATGDPAVGDPATELLTSPEVGSLREVQAILQKTEGLPLKQKKDSLPPWEPVTQDALCFLLLWQGLREREEVPGKFRLNSQLWDEARDLSYRGVTPLEFRDVVTAAWKVARNPRPEGYDKLFMARTHSQNFGAMCRHFERIEEELRKAGIQV